MSSEWCECDVVHAEIIEHVATALPPDELLAELADVFKVFGDSTRVRILSALQESEMCVCDIAALLQMTKSAISHQLRALRQAKLVKFRRDGKVVYYSLDDAHISGILKAGLEHVCE
jgi:ArsR family transcriptional regulator